MAASGAVADGVEATADSVVLHGDDEDWRDTSRWIVSGPLVHGETWTQPRCVNADGSCYVEETLPSVYVFAYVSLLAGAISYLLLRRATNRFSLPTREVLERWWLRNGPPTSSALRLCVYVGLLQLSAHHKSFEGMVSYAKSTPAQLRLTKGLYRSLSLPYPSDLALDAALSLLQLSWWCAALGLFEEVAAPIAAAIAVFLHGALVDTRAFNHSWYMPVYAMIALCFTASGRFGCAFWISKLTSSNSEPSATSASARSGIEEGARDRRRIVSTRQTATTGRRVGGDGHGWLCETSFARQLLLVFAVYFYTASGVAKLVSSGWRWFSHGETICWMMVRSVIVEESNAITEFMSAQNLQAGGRSTPPLCVIGGYLTGLAEMASPLALVSPALQNLMVLSWFSLHVGISQTVGRNYFTNMVCLLLLVRVDAMPFSAVTASARWRRMERTVSSVLPAWVLEFGKQRGPGDCGEVDNLQETTTTMAMKYRRRRRFSAMSESFTPHAVLIACCSVLAVALLAASVMNVNYWPVTSANVYATIDRNYGEGSAGGELYHGVPIEALRSVDGLRYVAAYCHSTRRCNARVLEAIGGSFDAQPEREPILKDGKASPLWGESLVPKACVLATRSACAASKLSRTMKLGFEGIDGNGARTSADHAGDNNDDAATEESAEVFCTDINNFRGSDVHFRSADDGRMRIAMRLSSGLPYVTTTQTAEMAEMGRLPTRKHHFRNHLIDIVNMAFRYELAEELIGDPVNKDALAVNLRERLRRFVSLSRSGANHGHGCIAAAFLSATEFTSSERRAFEAVHWGRRDAAVEGADRAGVDVGMVREMRGHPVYYLNWNRTSLEVVGPMLDLSET